jgi:hypothetical protein
MIGYVFRNVDNAAHVGGFVAGLLLGLLLEVEPKPRRRDLPMAVLAAVGVLAVLGSIALSARSPVWKMVKELEQQASQE